MKNNGKWEELIFNASISCFSLVQNVNFGIVGNESLGHYRQCWLVKASDFISFLRTSLIKKIKWVVAEVDFIKGGFSVSFRSQDTSFLVV